MAKIKYHHCHSHKLLVISASTGEVVVTLGGIAKDVDLASSSGATIGTSVGSVIPGPDTAISAGIGGSLGFLGCGTAGRDVGRMIDKEYCKY